MPMGSGRGIHDSGFHFHPGSDHFSPHRTGGNADTRMATYPFDLPSVREGVDIQDAMLFSKPYRGLDGCPISFDTLQVEISLTYKEGKAWARHGNIFLLNAMGTFPCTIVSGM
jgi:hypothetical protein